MFQPVFAPRIDRFFSQSYPIHALLATCTAREYSLGGLPMSLMSAGIVVCETVLFEKTDLVSAIRIMSALKLAGGSNFAHFFVLTFLTSHPGDLQQHVLKIQVTEENGSVLGEAADYHFLYGYKLDVSGPGGFVLSTEFNLDTAAITKPARCLINAFLDGQCVAQTPLTLRR
jgi:hypothetical protein